MKMSLKAIPKHFEANVCLWNISVEYSNHQIIKPVKAEIGFNSIWNKYKLAKLQFLNPTLSIR
jgi:hypothetical protein